MARATRKPKQDALGGQSCTCRYLGPGRGGGWVRNVTCPLHGNPVLETTDAATYETTALIPKPRQRN